jgi:large conductance mechanosensitive channel
MSILKEFKAFAMRGNVVDLAVGVVIGAAFGKIVSSFVNDILMPPIGLLIGNSNFSDLSLTLKDASLDEAGNAIAAITLNYGMFIQTVLDFIIIAFAIFLVVKAMNRMKKKEAATPAPPPGPTKDQELLTEIRDLLKK